MKQILSLALALLPCLALAQYPSNGNQKITLGEQTTADGLIWRGVSSDTTLTVKSDTAAYFVLDTANLNLYTYKVSASGKKWIQLGSDTTSLNLVSRFAAKLNISDTASMLTNYYRSGRTGIIQASDVPTLNQNTTGSAATLTTSRTFQTNLASTSTASFNGSANVTPGVTGTLPVANGGTNTSTAFTAGSVVFAGSGGTYTQDNSGLFYDNTEDRLGIGTTSPSDKLHVVGAARLSSVGAILIISLSGIGSPSYILFDATAEPTGAKWRFGYTGFATADKFSLGNQTKNLIGFSVDSLCNFGIKTASPTEALHVFGNARITGNIAGGVTSATARLHLASGTATASTAPLKFTSGTNLTTAEAGAMEFNGTNLFFSPSTTRHTVNHGLTGSATLDFGSTNAQLSTDLTITVTGAADGDVVSLGVPNAAVNANTSYSAWVSAANTVTVRFNNYSSGTINPASGTFKVFVTK